MLNHRKEREKKYITAFYLEAFTEREKNLLSLRMNKNDAVDDSIDRSWTIFIFQIRMKTGNKHEL